MIKEGINYVKKIFDKDWFSDSVWVFLFIQSDISSTKDSSLPVLNTKAKNIAVFKNGLGFFMREGTVCLNNG